MRRIIALAAVLAAAFAVMGCEGLQKKDVDQGQVDRMMDKIQSTDGNS